MSCCAALTSRPESGADKRQTYDRPNLSIDFVASHLSCQQHHARSIASALSAHENWRQIYLRHSLNSDTEFSRNGRCLCCTVYLLSIYYIAILYIYFSIRSTRIVKSPQVNQTLFNYYKWQIYIKFGSKPVVNIAFYIESAMKR